MLKSKLAEIRSTNDSLKESYASFVKDTTNSLNLINEKLGELATTMSMLNDRITAIEQEIQNL
jgi:predicted  nucleic acid-binding Zn-ribbon protein